jgi:hypothetical protein
MKTLGQIARDAFINAGPMTDWDAAAQAVRAAVIEECAKVCESSTLERIGRIPKYENAHECARAIRALKP